jgi:hypothetical protein
MLFGASFETRVSEHGTFGKREQGKKKEKTPFRAAFFLW